MYHDLKIMVPQNNLLIIEVIYVIFYDVIYTI